MQSDKETKNLMEIFMDKCRVDNHVCPHCGRCPHCGKRYNDYEQPYYPQPYWPKSYTPYWHVSSNDTIRF